MLGKQAGDSFGAANSRLLDFVEVLVELLNSAEFLDQRRRRFLADSGDAFDIVYRIARQRLNIDERRWLDAEAFAYFA